MRGPPVPDSVGLIPAVLDLGGGVAEGEGYHGPRLAAADDPAEGGDGRHQNDAVQQRHQNDQRQQVAVTQDGQPVVQHLSCFVLRSCQTEEMKKKRLQVVRTATTRWQHKPNRKRNALESFIPSPQDGTTNH